MHKHLKFCFIAFLWKFNKGKNGVGNSDISPKGSSKRVSRRTRCGVGFLVPYISSAFIRTSASRKIQSPDPSWRKILLLFTLVNNWTLKSVYFSRLYDMCWCMFSPLQIVGHSLKESKLSPPWCPR